MDPEEELTREVYAHFGLAAYHGQCFEVWLSNILLFDARIKGDVLVTVPKGVVSVE